MLNNYQKVHGLLGLATKAGKITSGSEACMEAIEKRSVKLILLAKDASERTKELFETKCREFNIPIYQILSIEEISQSIGKPNKAVIGIKDKGFSEAILKNINGGEVIG